MKSPFAHQTLVSASQEHHSIKSSTSQFYLCWIIPISIKMCCLFSHFFCQLQLISLSLHQDPKEEAVTPWLHFPLIFSNPLQSGFHPLHFSGTEPVKVTSDLALLILSPYLTYKWQVISLIHFVHLDSSMAHTLPGFPPVLLVVPI